MKKCIGCGNEFSIYQVVDGKKKNLKNRTYCLECHPFGQSIHRKKTPDEIRTRNAEKARKWYHTRKEKDGVDPIYQTRFSHRSSIIKLIGGCQICGYNKCNRNIAFHHLHSKEGSLTLRDFQKGLETIINEIRKCIMVCHNCHGEIHDGIISQEILPILNRYLIEKLGSPKSWDEIINGESHDQVPL